MAVEVTAAAPRDGGARDAAVNYHTAERPQPRPSRRRPRGARCVLCRRPSPGRATSSGGGEFHSGAAVWRCHRHCRPPLTNPILSQPPPCPRTPPSPPTRPSPDRHGREGGVGQSTGGRPAEEEGRAGDAVTTVTWLP